MKLNIKQAKLTISIILLFAISTLGFSQSGKISGIIKDAYSNKPVEFANMIIRNTTIGTSTDSLGRFILEGIEDEFIQIQISSLGYKPKITESFRISKVRSNFVEIDLEPSSESLEEVTVRASPFADKIESPVSLRRIGIDQIEKSAGANRDISKVIQSFPGVASSASFRNDIIVRGGGPSENKFFIDGIEIPTINHFSTQGASGGPVGILNVDFIREVDFYSSAFPSARGNALSSVMEFKQMDGSKEGTDFKAVLGASEVALSASAPVSEKTSMFVSARRSYLQFLFSALDLPFLPTFTDFQFKTKTKINQKNEITFLGFGAIDQFRLNKNAGDTPENQYTLAYLPVNEQWNYTFGVNYKHYFGKSYLTVVASRNHLDNSSYKYQDNIEVPENLTYDYASSEIENKFRTEINTAINKLTINAGVGLESANYTNDTYRLLYENEAPVQDYYSSELSFFKYAMFGSVGLPVWNDRVKLSLGLRMDANNYSSEMNNLLDQISPRFSASVKLSQPLYFNFNVGRYYQLPAYTTMGYRNEEGDLLNKQNGLKYINADHIVAGFAYQPNNFTKITLEGFYKDYGNYPFSVNDSVSIASKGGDFGVIGDEEVTPTSDGRAYGFEIMARQTSAKGYSFIAAYTFVRSEFTNINGEFVPSSWDSKHLFTATVNKSLKRNWDIGLKWRYLGGLPYTPVDVEKSSLKEAWDVQGREYLDYGQFNEERLEAFHQLDLRIDKTYTFSKWSLGFYLDIQNLYNFKAKEPTKYIRELDGGGNPIIVNPEAPANEQQYSLVPLNTESGTVLPTIGIIAEF